ncbi:hypothetical protein [Sphingobacterium sp. 2149]|uniref:hypothetical protein n=1 Tax=Sphingobacterium sp. 2149 TaxID=2817763 RepID=UPI00285B4454|nr:hypothetical protein [Sphingobacterium sp. 2149]MDR6734219.1 hypothetical protein [Sphingobacterium sp. 2149]
MIKRLSLKSNQLIVFAIIFGFSQDRESYFKGSLRYIQDVLQVSRPTASDVLKDLVEKELIIKKSRVINSVTFNYYKVNFDFLDKLMSGSETLGVVKNLYRGSKETLQGGSKESLHNNTIIDNTKNNTSCFTADAEENNSEGIFDFEKVWRAFQGKRSTYEKDFKIFQKKSEAIDIDFKKLYEQALNAENIYFQAWLNNVIPKVNEFGKKEFRQTLLEMGVDKQYVDDWISVRTSKKAVFTATALQLIFDECNKHNFPIEEAIKMCAGKGWQTFKYQWYLNENKDGTNKPVTAGQDRQQRIDGVKRMGSLARQIINDAISNASASYK